MVQRSAQLTLTLSPQGDLIAETFTNGQRAQEQVLSLAQIRAMLLDQRDAIKAEEAKQAERDRAASVALHNQLYRGIAVRHGHLFAKKTIGDLIRPGPQPRSARNEAQAQASKAKPVTADMLDL